MKYDLGPIIPVLATPYLDDGSIDGEALGAEIDMIAGTSVETIAFGFASDVLMMTDQERDGLLRDVVARADGRLRVIASVQANSTVAATQRVAAALENGAGGVMLTPPAGVSDPEKVLEHFASAVGVSAVPIIVQDAPGVTGIETSTVLLARLAVEVPNVVAVKVEAMPTAPRISALVQAVGEGCVVLGGAGGLDFLNEVRRGSRGGMPSASLVEIFTSVWEWQVAGRFDDAAAGFAAALPLLALSMRDIQTYSYSQREILRRRGIFGSSRPRRPWPEADERLQRELREAIRLATDFWTDLGLELVD